MAEIINLIIIVGVIGAILEVINVISFYNQTRNLENLKKLIKISSNQYEERKHENLSNFIQLSNFVIITFLTFMTVCVSIISIQSNIQISNANQELLNRTSSSNWAHLEFSFGRPDETRIIVSAERLAESTKSVTERYAIPFTIINSGKVNTGDVYNRGYWNDKNIFTVLFPDQGPINISAQSGVKKLIFLSQSSCPSNQDQKCDSSKLPHKEYDLILKLNCEFCEPNQRVIEKTIPLCIYHNSEETNYCNKYQNI